MVSVQSNRGGHAAFMEGAPMLDATTFIGLDVHARSIKAVSLDVMTGEVRAATFGYDGRGVGPFRGPRGQVRVRIRGHGLRPAEEAFRPGGRLRGRRRLEDDLVFEAGEFSRFGNARSFAAWVGLTPSEHSSGESRPQGRDHQGRQQAPEEDAGRGRVALPDVLGAAEGARQGPGPGPGRPQACRQGRAEACREARGPARARGPRQNVATARELACWVWAVGLMAEEA